MARPLRILHAPADVGGHAYGLSRAERELGLESDVAVFAAGPFGYGFDINLHAGVDRPVWVRLARRAAFLRKAARAYDVFHFNFGQTLLSVRQLSVSFDEIALLKRLGKTVLVTYQGCDVRPKAECPCRRPSCFADDRYRQPAAARVLRHADQRLLPQPRSASVASWSSISPIRKPRRACDCAATTSARRAVRRCARTDRPRCQRHRGM